MEYLDIDDKGGMIEVTRGITEGVTRVVSMEETEGLIIKVDEEDSMMEKQNKVHHR